MSNKSSQPRLASVTKLEPNTRREKTVPPRKRRKKKYVFEGIDRGIQPVNENPNEQR